MRSNHYATSLIVVCTFLKKISQGDVYSGLEAVILYMILYINFILDASMFAEY